ncbi:MAG: hypothetical protein RQ754_02110 [Desulfuromonadales bacterium]|nr:hypothetical protein [Desulfuromonadales bacterium]
MKDLSQAREQRWPQIVMQMQQEYQALPRAEKIWISRRLQELERLQVALDALFRKAGGEGACADCEGACCARGHNHLVLPNLLAYLQQGQLPPVADFSQTCPWLGAQGCVHGVSRRPYNCVTFLCAKLEERLPCDEVEEFYRLDRELRLCYRAFTEHFAGGGMSGLLIQAERLSGSPFLAPPARSR